MECNSLTTNLKELVGRIGVARDQECLNSKRREEAREKEAPHEHMHFLIKCEPLDLD